MIEESRLTGLIKHAEEINAIVKESLQGALIALMRRKTYERITVAELCAKAYRRYGKILRRESCRVELLRE